MLLCRNEFTEILDILFVQLKCDRICIRVFETSKNENINRT